MRAVSRIIKSVFTLVKEEPYVNVMANLQGDDALIIDILVLEKKAS